MQKTEIEETAEAPQKAKEAATSLSNGSVKEEEKEHSVRAPAQQAEVPEGGVSLDGVQPDLGSKALVRPLILEGYSNVASPSDDPATAVTSN